MGKRNGFVRSANTSARIGRAIGENNRRHGPSSKTAPLVLTAGISFIAVFGFAITGAVVGSVVGDDHAMGWIVASALSMLVCAFSFVGALTTALTGSSRR